VSFWPIDQQLLPVGVGTIEYLVLCKSRQQEGSVLGLICSVFERFLFLSLGVHGETKKVCLLCVA
jgi:hypothetical protein